MWCRMPLLCQERQVPRLGCFLRILICLFVYHEDCCMCSCVYENRFVEEKDNMFFRGTISDVNR